MLKEKTEALKGAGRSPIEVASPYARLARLLSRILAFEMRLAKEAANPKPSTPAAEPAAKAEPRKLEAAEAEHSCAEATERDLERELERDGEAERREGREGREEVRKALRLYEWAKLPFEEVVARICKEFESIARAIGDDPLVQEARALAEKVLRPPPPDPAPLPAPNRSRLPPDALQAALLRSASPRAPPDASPGGLLGSVPAIPKT